MPGLCGMPVSLFYKNVLSLIWEEQEKDDWKIGIMIFNGRYVVLRSSCQFINYKKTVSQFINHLTEFTTNLVLVLLI